MAGADNRVLVELLEPDVSERDQRRVAGSLARRGIEAGDRIAFRTGTSAAMLSAIIGSLRVGVVPVMLNPALLEHETTSLIDDASPSLVVDESVLAELLDGPEVEIAAVPLARPMHYTSGTTGAPKGVWSGVLAEGDAQQLVGEERELWGFDSDDRHLVCSPLHHSAPIRFSMGTLLAGGSVVLVGRFDTARITEAINRFRPTTSFMVPAHVQRLFSSGLEPDFSSFRLLAHAGAPCPEALKWRAIEAFPDGSVWEFYGSTEGQFTACSTHEWLERPGTVGRARPNRKLGIDSDGTVWCGVPRYARFCYWGDPDRTSAAWRPDPGAPVAEFTVGDLGRLDSDGYLWLDGRRDDLIISGGVNVYPVEVERALSTFPGVHDVVVFGVCDERWGERVCAAVIGDVEPQALISWARSRLAAYKCPKDVWIVDGFPLTATGKVRRSAVARHLGLETDGGGSV